MEKSVFTPNYDAFRVRLVELRKSAGLNQRELAKRLGRERSFVSRIELGERRLDLVEFYWVCHACGRDPAAVFADILEDFSRIERMPKTKRKKI